MYCDEDNKSDTSFGKNISSMIPLLYDCVKGYWKRHDVFLKKLDIPIVGQTLSVSHYKAHFICLVLKTEWQIHRSIIGDRPPNWSARKLLMFCSVIRVVNQPFLKPANEEGLNQSVRQSSSQLAK